MLHINPGDWAVKLGFVQFLSVLPCTLTLIVHSVKLCALLSQRRFVFHVENLNYLVVKTMLQEPHRALLDASLCLCRQNVPTEHGGALSLWQEEIRHT